MRKILCIDDDQLILKMLGCYLDELGYDVSMASDGEQGLEKFAVVQPDIVLVDLRMPKVDGFEVLGKLSTEAPNVPLLVISGEGEMADVIQALRLGAWNYLTKPVNNLWLIQHAIEQALDKADLLRENEAYKQGLENKLASIVNNFRGFIFTADKAGRITYMNQPLIDYIGRDALGESCCQAIWGLESNCEVCPLENKANEKEIKFEMQNVRDGRWFVNIYSPILDKDGEVLEVQAILYDITERKEAEKEQEEREEFLRRENERLRAGITDRYKLGQIIGKSLVMQKVYETIINAAASEVAVVVYGESGTGKELVAKAIHENSDRSRQELVYVNCGAIPENLIESEFFGYKKGAFTGAIKDKHGFLDIADGGTLFLDEVGEISLNMQVKLLRAIEGNGYSPVGSTEVRHPNVRIIAATNRDLKEQVKKGAMRQDFLYRIHIIPIYLPPLRERREDIRLLVEHFLSRYEPEKVPPLPAKLRQALHDYNWPGNVRELQNTLHRFVNLGQLDFMGESLYVEGESDQLAGLELDSGNQSLTEMMDRVERTIIFNACERHNYHQGNTAAALQVDRKTLYRKLKQHGIEKA